MSESFIEEVEGFRKACNYIRLRPPGPDKIQALRELYKKQGKKQLGETRVLQDVLLEYVSVEIDDDDFKLAKEEAEKKVKADTKGNKLMDEELFTEETIKRLTEPEGAAPRNYESMVVDIETYTNHTLS